jgi:anti-sigma regulatory factor (Ser/Thr protein kinase)
MAALVRHQPVAQSALVHHGQPLDEFDWTTALRQQHRYRCWVWRFPRLEVAGIARSVALEAVRDWRLGPLADDVAVCVSELITNAMTHGQLHNRRGPVSLGLRYFPTTCLFIEVGDGNEECPVIKQVADCDEALSALASDGRGLLLVQWLSDHVWWCRQRADGKIVYARLDTPRYFAPLAGGRRG